MFRFLEISLHGWDHWQQVRVPLDRDVILLTGPNGSGKTTFLDSIRQLLGAPRLSSKRRLQHYMKNGHQPSLLRAVVSNSTAEARARPFFKERITADEVTLACALVPSSGGSPEKRFCILPGRPSVTELQARLLNGKDGKDYVGPELYERKLQHAGVSQSLMSVLQIEQGKTHALFERTPRELFRQVLDMLGDKAVLDRYTEARRRYDDASKELFHQTQALLLKQSELTELNRKVRERKDWEEAEARVQELERRLPAAQYQILFREQADLGTKQQELRTKVRNGEAQSAVLAKAVAQAETAALTAHTALDEAEAREKEKSAAWGVALASLSVADTRLHKLSEKEQKATAMPTRDLAELASRQRSLQRAVFERTAERDQRAAGLAEHTARVESLRAGLPVYPARVRQTLEALDKEGVAYRVLCREIMDVEQDMARSVEAALGDARFALLVEKALHARVFEVARHLGFPSPVFSGEALDAETVAGPVRVAAGAPTWLVGALRAASFSADGTFRDERGSWTGVVEGRFLGARAIQEELDEAERVLPAARSWLAQAEVALSAAQEEAEETSGLVEAERERLRLLSETAVLPEVRLEVAELAGALANAEHAKGEAIAQRKSASEAREAANSALRSCREEQVAHDHKLAGERDALQAGDRRARELEDELRRLRESITPAHRVEAEAGRLDGPHTVAQDLENAQRRLRALPTPPPPEVRLEARHLEKNVEELERHVRQRNTDAASAEQELSACRRRYLEIVNHTLLEYRRRAVELGRSADVKVQMELPVLRDDERSLDEASIAASFGFDGKEVASMGDSSFSGGQQVVAGLILLMAMAETDGHGFFMLDEPFAHLSVDRVEEVGRFLRGSRAQFLITAPTSLDRAQLDPASMVIVLQKKRKDARHAPPPVVALA